MTTTATIETFSRSESRLVFLGETSRLTDESTTTPWDGAFTNDPWAEGTVGVAPGLLAFVTDSPVVLMTVELVTVLPTLLAPDAQWVVETGFELGGPATLCTGYLDEPRPVAVPAGAYVVRVSKLRDDAFVIQLAPGKRALVVAPAMGPSGAGYTTVSQLPSDLDELAAITNDRSLAVGRRLAALVAIARVDGARAMEVRDALVDDDLEVGDRPVDDQTLVEVGYEAIEAVQATQEPDEDEASDEASDEDGEDEDDEEGDEDGEDEDDEEGDEDGEDEDDEEGDSSSTCEGLDLQGVDLARLEPVIGKLAMARDVTASIATCNQTRAYHFPGEPPFVSLVATTWGAFPPGTALRDALRNEKAHAEALAFARKMSHLLRHTYFSSDTDCGYAPFVAPVASTSREDLEKALGLRPGEGLRIERPKSTRDGRSAADNLFFAHSEDVRKSPSDYLSRRDRAVLAEVDRAFRSASKAVAFVWFEEGPRYTDTPILVLAWIPGFVAGVVSFGSWT